MNIYYWIAGELLADDLYYYCGGTIVVAANSEEEAKDFIMNSSEANSFNGKYTKIYNLKYIHKIMNATINVDKPQILINESYVE